MSAAFIALGAANIGLLPLAALPESYKQLAEEAMPPKSQDRGRVPLSGMPRTGVVAEHIANIHSSLVSAHIKVMLRQVGD